MYCESFGLNVLPFNNTPDPRFFFNTPDHEEALASLIYAAQERKGFVLVTGEVGSGKTLLSRMLLSRLPAGAKTAVISNTRLNGRELLLAICREFEIDTADDATHAQLCHAIEKYLVEQYAKDRLAVVVLDEAQNLPIEAFEELRMLGNLEADDAKLLQVLILGQPELQQVFRRPDVRQLYQRVFRTFHLKALSPELTADYIAHRLAVAGQPAIARLFDAGTIDAVYQHSQGIPRLINQICDNSLLAAYGESASIITAKMVNDTVDQMLSLKAESSVSQSQTVRSLLAVGASGQRERNQSGVSQSTDTDRLYLDLSSRLDCALQSFATLKSDLRGVNENGDSAKQTSAELRQLRSEASIVLDELRADRDASKQQMQELMSHATAQVERVDERAARSLTENQSAVASMQEEARRLMHEVRDYIERKESRIADLAADEQAGLQTARQLRSQSADMLKQAETTSRQTQDMVAQVRTRTEEDRRAFEKDKAALLEQFKELFDQVRSQSEAYAVRNADLVEHQRAEFEQSRLQMQGLGEQLRQRIIALDKRLTTVDDFITQQATPLTEQRRQWQEEIGTALVDMQRARTAVEVELSEHRAGRAGFVEEAAKILERTREETASLLAGLRGKAGRSMDNLAAAWKKAAHEGETVTAAIQARITEIRQSADSTNMEISPIIDHLQTRIGNLTGHAGKLQEDVEHRVAKAKAEFDDMSKRSRETLDQRVKEVEVLQRRKLDTFKTEADSFAQRLVEASNNAALRAETLSKKLEDRLGIWQQQFIECHTQYEKETARLRADVDAITRRVSTVLAESESQLTAATSNATQSSKSIREELQHAISTADAQTRKTHETAEAFTVSMIERLGQVAREARSAIKQADDTICAIRGEREDSAKQLRDAFMQMTARADGARIDLANLAEEIHRVTSANVAEVRVAGQQTRDGVLTVLEQARKEATDTLLRLGAVAAHAERTAAQAESTADRLLNQVQAGATALLEHANVVLAQAPDAAKRVEELVQTVLADAHTIKNEIAQTRDEIIATSSTALASLQAATDTHEKAEARAEQILATANTAREKAEAALSLPSTIIERAAENASSLSDLCQKTSKIVKHLAVAEARAIREHRVIEAANDSATQTTEVLKQHTQRVAQLVSVIRQLYGAIDSKVDRIRQRLSSADELCRVVPREIDALRDALSSSATAPARLAATGTDAVAPMRSPIIKRPAPTNPPKVLPRQTQVEPIPFAQGSLGDIVQRNQKLNTWLKDMLNETDQPAVPAVRGNDATPVERIDASTTAPVVKK